MKFREKLILSHILVSLASAVASLVLINYFVRYFFIRIMIGRGISIVIPEAGTRFLNTVRFVILISGFVSVVISVVVALAISHYVIKPIVEMKEFARKVSQGDFEARIKKESDDEIGDLANSLNYMAFHLGEIESMRTKLMQNISHDLRTPLSSIKGYLEVIKDEGFSKEEKENALNIIENEIEKMEKMTKDLTRLSTADSKALPLEFEKVEMDTLLKEVFESFSMKIKDKGLEAILKTSEKPIFIMGDPQKLKEIFSNLIDNAIKFTEKGFIKLEVVEDKDKAVIKVQDSGVGIKEEDIPHIFERFYKGKNAQSAKEGMGIGLSIVKEYVYAHNGEIEVNSKENIGTSFILKFPKVK